MKKQGWRAGTVGGFGILAVWFVACAGEDTPPVDNALRGALASNFDDQAGGGAAGAGGDSGGGAAGAAGSGGDIAAAAGSGGRPTGTTPGGAAGTGGGNPLGGGAGAGSSGARCDAFNTIIKSSCGLAGCHGPNSSQGSFGVSEAGIADFVDAPSEAFGAACAAVYIDSKNPQDSLLYTKVINKYPSGCGQLQMPLTGDLLDDTQQACLLDWLGQFAQ